MSLWLKYLVQLSKWRFELDIRRLYFLVYDYLFTLSSRYRFFAIPSLILSHLELWRIVTKVNFKYFNGNFPEAWLFQKFIFELDTFLHSFKITCILSRQVISLKKMVVLSAKFTILISWSPICISLILLLKLMKLESLAMWMNLSPYPNLCKAEKLKSQSTLRILQKDFYSVYLTHQLCNK